MVKNRLIINPGAKYNMLTVVSDAPNVRLPSGQVNRMILCKCDCGKEKVIRLVHLKNNKIRSCGCLNGRERHGLSSTKLYKVWLGIRNRCYRPSYSEWHLYGGKGIKLCDEWNNSFHAFYDWCLANGWKDGLHTDRIDSNKDYEPTNCRFVTPLVNVCNISTTIYAKHNGGMASLRLLVEQAGKSKDYHTIRCRFKRGWSAKRAIETPIKEGNYFKGPRNR
jgi:hypothetical protein